MGLQGVVGVQGMGGGIDMGCMCGSQEVIEVKQGVGMQELGGGGWVWGGRVHGWTSELILLPRFDRCRWLILRLFHWW